MMPDGSGIDVYEGLRRRDADLARRLIFMTGGACSPEARALVERAGLRSLPKPLDTTELRGLIARIAQRE